MTSGTLLTLAPTGAESAKADVPALPVTVEEVVTTARDCQALGAAVLHLHVRGTDTRPTLDLPRVLAPLRRGSGDPTTRVEPSGAVWWGTTTPVGPTTLRLSRNGAGEVEAAAWGAGAELVTLPGVDHFAVIDPATDAWRACRDAADRLLAG